MRTFSKLAILSAPPSRTKRSTIMQLPRASDPPHTTTTTTSSSSSSSSVDRWTQVMDLYVQSVVYHSEYRTIRIQYM